MTETKKPSRRQGEALQNFQTDDKFLYEHLRDTRAEMTWRRELEFRLMQFMLIFYPVIGTVMIELFKSDVNAFVYLVVVVGAVAFLEYTTKVITKRIANEHQVYVELSQQVLQIWTYFGLFEPGAYLKDRIFLDKKLLDEEIGLGKGLGYKKTQDLIWTTSFAVMGVLIVLAFIKVLMIYW